MNISKCWIYLHWSQANSKPTCKMSFCFVSSSCDERPFLTCMFYMSYQRFYRQLSEAKPTLCSCISIKTLPVMISLRVKAVFLIAQPMFSVWSLVQSWLPVRSVWMCCSWLGLCSTADSGWLKTLFLHAAEAEWWVSLEVNGFRGQTPELECMGDSGELVQSWRPDSTGCQEFAGKAASPWTWSQSI